MTGAERKKLFEDFFDGLTKYTSFGKFNFESVRNPKKEAKKEFSELSETRRVDIMEILAALSGSTHNKDIEVLGTYCDFKAKDMIMKKEQSLRRMDESNNSGMEEYNKRKEKQENFYWKYFRRNSSYIHPEWHGNKPSEDRLSDEELDVLVDEYLSGMGKGSLRYIQGNERVFEENEIKLTFQKFAHPKYPQLHGEFVPNLSILDAIFNIGPEDTLKKLNQN